MAKVVNVKMWTSVQLNLRYFLSQQDNFCPCSINHWKGEKILVETLTRDLKFYVKYFNVFVYRNTNNQWPVP